MAVANDCCCCYSAHRVKLHEWYVGAMTFVPHLPSVTNGHARAVSVKGQFLAVGPPLSAMNGHR